VLLIRPTLVGREGDRGDRELSEQIRMEGGDTDEYQVDGERKGVYIEKDIGGT